MRRILFGIIGVCTLGICLILIFPSNKVSVHEKKVKKYDTTLSVPISQNKEYLGKLEDAYSNINFSGTAILVKNNKIVDSYAIGESSGKELNSLTTTFEIDSLQKALTAGLVMKQVRIGKINLSNKLSQYFPEIPGSQFITLRMLIDMRSGLSMQRIAYKGQNLSKKELLRKIKKNVRFEPLKAGTWSYQSVNYVLLSAILEKVTGKTYEQLFKKMYINKLHLKQTEMAYNTNVKTDQANGYLLVNKEGTLRRKLTNTNRATVQSEFGTGQIFMSVGDYYKTLSALINGKLLGKEVTDMLYSSRIYPIGKNYHGGLYVVGNCWLANGYGYGFEDHVRISSNGKDALVVFSNHQYKKHKDLIRATDKLAKELLG
ncbi:beta-lactamase family protein [Pediococcus pentosaceus]|jgi:CubicO group peptidase (beta-lactamase class C family)|uniref:serine hydrolase domain-containing protein n=1 Tax=Pediococcus pentosaceus TaxID=1255 RepID=UPI00211D139E|nr:serine hydrolase domain-containing protein [Pediococcus pentosaceus]MCQ9316558.1 beta-lactamase family protein [Pediococcus pentosaceus]MCQ9339047.1 beta-lactamase family protein [Pediococcus pentosaceus]